MTVRDCAAPGSSELLFPRAEPSPVLPNRARPFSSPGRGLHFSCGKHTRSALALDQPPSMLEGPVAILWRNPLVIKGFRLSIKKFKKNRLTLMRNAISSLCPKKARPPRELLLRPRLHHSVTHRLRRRHRHSGTLSRKAWDTGRTANAKGDGHNSLE